jgi:prolyl-tRNA editing enzyme YbaK/EbsC (Cys-tRNA(Pro) deacylase)
MKDALAIHRMLLERETLHEIVRLPRAIANADELPKALGLPAKHCLATRVYLVDPATQGEPYLAAVVVNAGVRIRTEALIGLFGARRVRGAPADAVNAATEYAAELVAPLLLPEDLPLFIEQRAIDNLHGDSVVYTTTGEPRTALGIRALDLFALCGGKPVDLPPGTPMLRRARARRSAVTGGTR